MNMRSMQPMLMDLINDPNTPRCIAELVSRLLSDTTQLVQVKELTPQALKALQTLIDMINSLPEGPFLDFLNNYVKYSVTQGEAPTIGLDGKILFNSVEYFSQPLKYSMSVYSSVYCLSGITDTRNYYIGSASNTVNRIGQHRDCLFGNRPKESVHIRLLESFNASDLTWSLFYTMTNYSKTALSVLPSSYELSFGEIQILRAITEFVPRILEQSLITELKPSLNHILNPVVFTYNIWDPSLLSVYDYATDGSHAVQIISAETGEILRKKISSISQACDILNISRNMANRYLNNDYGFFSDVFGSRIILSVIGMTLITKKIEHRKAVNYPTLTLPGGSLSDLAPYLVWAFKANKVDFIGPFVNYTQAFRTLEPNKITNNPNSSPSSLSNPIKRFANFDLLRQYELGEFYIAFNPLFPPYGSNPSSRKSPLYGKPIADKPFSK